MCTTVHRSCTTSHNGRLGSRWSRSWSVRNVNRFFPKTWSHFFWGGLQEAFWYYYCPTPWCRKFWWHGSLRCCSAGVGCGPLTSGEPGRNKGSHSHTEAHAGIIILGARQKRQQRVCFICFSFSSFVSPPPEIWWCFLYCGRSAAKKQNLQLENISRLSAVIFTACKVEFQPFNRSYSQLTIFIF